MDLKELPVRPGTKASMGGGGMDSQEAERSYRCMGKASRVQNDEGGHALALYLHVEKLATVHACSDGGASLFVPFCQTKVTGVKKAQRRRTRELFS